MGIAVTAPFETANKQALTPVYDVRMISEKGGPIRTSLGFEVMTEPFTPDPYDLVVVGASLEEASPGMIDLIRDAPSHCRRIAATCHGAFVLAEAGLLDGRRVTTHWDRAAEMREKYPAVHVEDDRIFVADGPIWTSAGMTAGIDLALALIEDDLGAEAARAIAKRLVLYHRRAGVQSQFSALLDMDPKSDRIRDVLLYMRANLHKRLTIDDLAEVAHLSPRQFRRAFRLETGHTPAKAIEQMRLEEARILIEDSHHSLDIVARLTGFGDRDRMRRAFARASTRARHMGPNQV